MSAWADGSASTANTASGAASIARHALGFHTSETTRRARTYRRTGHRPVEDPRCGAIQATLSEKIAVYDDVYPEYLALYTDLRQRFAALAGHGSAPNDGDGRRSVVTARPLSRDPHADFVRRREPRAASVLATVAFTGGQAHSHTVHL
jgi:hypothetical protein